MGTWRKLLPIVTYRTLVFIINGAKEEPGASCFIYCNTRFVLEGQNETYMSKFSLILSMLIKSHNVNNVMYTLYLTIGPYTEGEYRGVFWNLSKQKSGNFTNCWLTDSMKTEQTPDDILPRKSFTPKDVVNIVLMFMRYKDKEGYDAAYRVCIFSYIGVVFLY